MTDRWTWHGGGIEAAKRQFGADMPWLDLSTGINPHPWLGAAEMVFDWHRLPEPEALAMLETAAAAYFGTDPRHVCAVPGTEIGLRLTGRLIGGKARHVAPSYRTHGETVAESAAIAWNDVAQHDGTLILANPNNPDGRIIGIEAMRALMDGREPGGWLLVDEAFADPDPAISLAGDVGDARRLVVFRSFGKFFGLAGVRLGFVLGPEPLLKELRALLGAWPLSAAAIVIGAAAYRDGAWIARTRRTLHAEAATLDSMLIRRGYRPIGSCPLFRLAEVADAQAMFNRLARRAILTRPFADHPHWLRIGLPPTDAALARLEAALTDG